MIKGVSLRTRRSSLSLAEFRRIWLDEHAPLVNAVKQVRRYALAFVVDEPIRPDVPTQAMRVDAIAELCYEDRAQLAAAAASEEMRAVLANGAQHLAAIKTFITEEVAIIGGDAAGVADCRRRTLGRRRR